MQYIYSVIIVLFFCGCQNSYTYYPSQRENLSNEITQKVAKQVKSETGLIPCGTGGQTKNGIKMLALSFDYRDSLDVDSGRKLLIAAVERFVSAVNSDERIHPYLVDYPFGPKNIEIRIFIQKRDGSTFGPDKLCVVSAIDGILKYKVPKPDGFGHETIYTESYEEALEKLKESEAAKK